LQAFVHHPTHSALEASTFHSLHTHFAHQLVAGASVEQNSIGPTQIIISRDFKRIPEGLILELLDVTNKSYWLTMCRLNVQIGRKFPVKTFCQPFVLAAVLLALSDIFLCFFNGFYAGISTQCHF
jgi:hypothetical protein